MAISVNQGQANSRSGWHSEIAAFLMPLRLYQPGIYDGHLPDLADEKIRSALANPFFLKGLELYVITHKPFENFIARLRHALLVTAWDEKLGSIAAAVACYAFNTEYILDIIPDEAARLEALKREVETAPQKGRAALLGCYMPLHTLANADKIRAVLGDGTLAALQIDEPRDLAARRDAMQAATEIEAGVSSAVRAQYEESPYPRWRAAPTLGFDAQIRKFFPANPDILVAGCGTGQEAARIAVSLRDAKILALDLSRNSLAFASMQAERFGIRNITFRQGDILRLAGSGWKFDYISAMGVLHHMQDPIAGWRVLCGLLKPGGVMSVGLYSELGRQAVVAARAEIARRGFAATPDGIRAFRAKARDILPQHVMRTIEYWNDYYSLSMCRDLLFHVQEHRFTIPALRSALDELGLEFLQFGSAMPPPDGTTLDAWERHEQKNPAIFGNMYRFWCKKP